MWFIGVEVVEQETSASPPKKILDPPLLWAPVLTHYFYRKCK